MHDEASVVGNEAPLLPTVEMPTAPGEWESSVIEMWGKAAMGTGILVATEGDEGVREVTCGLAAFAIGPFGGKCLFPE